MAIPEFSPESEAPAEAGPRIDINVADAEALTRLPGIGPALAERIIAYREEHGPFFTVEELMAVSGIGPGLYGRLREQLTLSLGPPPDFESEFIPSAEEVHRSAFSLSAEALEEELASAAEGVEEADLSEDAPEAETEEAASAPSPPPPPPGSAMPPSTPRAQPAPPPARRSGWGWLSWLSAIFLGSILGMAFSLLVLAGINGVLDFQLHPAVVELREESVDLGERLASLQGEVDTLRQRMDRLEGVATRLEQAEAAVETLQGEMEALEAETEALQTTVEMLTEDLAEVEAGLERTETFFERLQVLLAELFGSAEETTPDAGEGE